jgi:transposase
MASSKEAYVGIDVAKLRNAVAIAESGRDGEIRYLGEFDASPESMKRLVRRLAAKHGQIHFCYEAGPTGYGLHRLITEMGHPCIVVAPSLIPRKASDRIKTNRRDAISLARLLRAGELTAVWVPNPAHEAMRNLVRSRTALVENIRAQKQQVSGFMLRHSRIFPRHKHWGARYWRWLREQSFEHPADQIVLGEHIEAIRLAEERLGRIEKSIAEFLPDWELARVVDALQALRGIDLITAVSFMVEVGDIRRFTNPKQLMSFLGLVPSERSTGETIRRGPITKMGNARVRRLLAESAWTYRFPPRVSRSKESRLAVLPPRIREIAWKAQSRLTTRYRSLVARGKKTTVACTAIARELVGFIWAVAMEVQSASLVMNP